MTYQELRDALKPHKAAKRTSISLNSKKAVLAAELERCEAMLVEVVEDAIAEVEQDIEIVTPIGHPVIQFLQLLWYSIQAIASLSVILTYSAGKAFRWLCDEAIDNGRFYREHYHPVIAKFCRYWQDVSLNLVSDMAIA